MPVLQVVKRAIKRQFRSASSLSYLPCCTNYGRSPSSKCAVPRTSTVTRQRKDDLRREISRLMQEHIDSLKEQAFVASTPEQIEKDRKRLERMREVSADYLAEMGRSRTKTGGDNMTEKHRVTLPGTVEKVIKPVADEPEKAQIAIHDGDPLYREIRIENS